MKGNRQGERARHRLRHKRPRDRAIDEQADNIDTYEEKEGKESLKERQRHCSASELLHIAVQYLSR